MYIYIYIYWGYETRGGQEGRLLCTLFHTTFFTTYFTTYFTTDAYFTVLLYYLLYYLLDYFTTYLKVTVFDRNPEGVVAVKFKQSAAAEDCIRVMNNRFFGGTKISNFLTAFSEVHTHTDTHTSTSLMITFLYSLLYYTGRQIECDFWDNKTNYMVKEKEGAKKEDARLQSFGAWLEDQVSFN